MTRLRPIKGWFADFKQRTASVDEKAATAYSEDFMVYLQNRGPQARQTTTFLIFERNLLIQRWQMMIELSLMIHN